jgi:hypothetical protein
MLRPTVGRPVCLGVKPHLGSQDQFFVTVKTVAGLLMWGILSDDRTGLLFTVVAGLDSAVILGPETCGTY